VGRPSEDVNKDDEPRKLDLNINYEGIDKKIANINFEKYKGRDDEIKLND